MFPLNSLPCLYRMTDLCLQNRFPETGMQSWHQVALGAQDTDILQGQPLSRFDRLDGMDTALIAGIELRLDRHDLLPSMPECCRDRLGPKALGDCLDPSGKRDLLQLSNGGSQGF